MKLLVRAGLVASLIFVGLSSNQASADTSMTFATKCGTLPQSGNPSSWQINCLLTNAAIEADIPPEVVKAVASQESGWTQFGANGQPYQSPDGGIGIMQVQASEQPNYDTKELENSIAYNIEAGVEILNSKYALTSLPKITGAGRNIIENWYFPVMAYNGIVQANSPLYETKGPNFGTINTNAYQEKVFSYLERDSFLDDSPLAEYPFSTSDFTYQTNSSDNITFNKLGYTLTDQMHASNYFFVPNDHVVVTETVNLRAAPTTKSNVIKLLSQNTPLIITGNFAFDQTDPKTNQFVWFPVKTEDGKLKGYVSSAYITKKLTAPVVNPVDDNDKTITGNAPANNRVQVMKGTSLVVSGKADSNGHFSLGITPQKSGTKLTVTYMDNLNATSLPKTISVVPPTPTVSIVTNKASSITGKTEANATVTVTVGGKNYSAKADKYGNYKVAIPIQNTGASLSVTSKDAAGNVSAARKVTVVRVAPNMPTVNTVKYYSSSITGKTEKYDSVTVKIGSKSYTAKANSAGGYKISIPKQKAGTKLYVTSKDSKGQVSATRTVTVSK